jgi:hypothetical protein
MKIPIGKSVRYKKKSYCIADFFKGKYKLLRPGEKAHWISPKTIGMKKP